MIKKQTKITSREAVTIKEGETHSEPVGGRGTGSLLLVGRANQVTAYYRYRAPDGERPWIDVGVLGATLTLKDARDKCVELAKLKTEHPFLREYIEKQAQIDAAAREAVKQQADRDALCATLWELLMDYVGHLDAQGKPSAANVRKNFISAVLNPHSALAARKAADILPGDIKYILTPITKRGSKSARNRLRANLHAAFAFGLKREFDETRESEKLFGLTVNPVAAVPVLTGVEGVGTRALDDHELRTFYHNVEKVPAVGFLSSRFVQFLIATAGQRPLQVLRVPWTEYNLTEGYFMIQDLKGKSGRARPHAVPLTPRAIAILREVQTVTGGFTWPFSYLGEAPLSVFTLKNMSQRFLQSDLRFIDGNPDKSVQPFTIRDLRRSLSQMMTRAKIPRETRNLLQNHGATGVDARHYDNDPVAFLAEKRDAMARYERALSRAIDGKDAVVVPIR
jgi:integrase